MYDWVGKGDLLEIEEEIEIWSYWQILFAQTRINLLEWDA